MSWTTLGTNTGGTVTALTIVATVGTNQAAGTITVVAAEGGTSTLTCAFTDSKGNTWATNGTGPGVARRIFAGSSKPSSLLVTSDTVTATFSATCTDRNIAVYAVAGLDQTTWFTAGNVVSTSGTSATPDSTAKTVSAGTAFALFGIFGYNSSGGAFTAGNDGNANSYTLLHSLTNSTAFRMATESTLSLSGFTTYKATGAIASVPFAAMVVLFNVATGGVVSFQVAIVGTGALTAAVKLTTSFKVAVAGTAVVTPSRLSETHSLQVAVAGTSQVTPSGLSDTRSLKVQVVGTSQVTANQSSDTTKRLAVAIVGTAALLIAMTAGSNAWRRRRRYNRITGSIRV